MSGTRRRDERQNSSRAFAGAVGKRVRRIREYRGVSLSALAELAGVGKGTLSELESGKRNPTVDTLYALAGPLGVPLTALLGEDEGVEVAEREANSALDVTVLEVRHYPDGSTVEIYRLRMVAGVCRRSPAHGPGVMEHVLVVSGRALVGPVAAKVELGTGESTVWQSDVPHEYLAVGDADAEAVLVIRTPDVHLTYR